ncbi:MAG: hypothetical protein K2K19_04290, partial [Acetatifactor sp.]|nr:hypothetical protein [Acetatifactor sp.]
YDCGEQYHLVGFPTEDGGRNYWNCNSYIVVNKHSEHKEQIKEYLNMLFRYDNQKICSFPVRDDLLEGNLHYDETNHRFLYDDGEYNYWVYEKSDGGSWEEEYMELTNSCVPNRGGTDKIADIIFEEAESYFVGDKDAQAAASMIQNRVQLYLNEQK